MLEQFVLFRDLTAEQLGSMEARSRMRRYRKRTIIISEGDPSAGLYLIQCGKVRTFVTDDHGRELTFEALGPGGCFGEHALVDDGSCVTSVIALTDVVTVLVPRSAFEELLPQCPSLAIALIALLAGRVRALYGRAKTLALMDVSHRVAKALVALAREHDGVLVVDSKPTHQEIANTIGASREMVSRILKHLADAGDIEIEEHRIVLHDKLIADAG
ncbi:MAG: Crp/Fnr family transcriptional regulator [Gammaproteobacteria bacterium]